MKRFESYAQNGEDIRLYRCFGRQRTGFYIDVGSSEPTRHSATYALYRAGWRGIALEPLADRWRELVELRPRDINLNIALGEGQGKTTLFRSLGRGGTSTIMPDLGKEMQRNHEDVIGVEVEVDTLENICDAHLPGVQTYDVLKIDVEGAENLVLAGANFSSCRPLVIVAEGPAKPPAWERMLLDSGYLFVTHDGVNRWFVCSSRADLAKVLRRPITAHDRYLNVDQYGSPFLNFAHPEQRWSAAFGYVMLKAIQTLDAEVLIAAYLEPFPQHLLEKPANPTQFSQATRLALGRRPTEEELSYYQSREPRPTLQHLYQELICSDEFRACRGRAIASF